MVAPTAMLLSKVLLVAVPTATHLLLARNAPCRPVLTVADPRWHLHLKSVVVNDPTRQVGLVTHDVAQLLVLVLLTLMLPPLPALFLFLIGSRFLVWRCKPLSRQSQVSFFMRNVSAGSCFDFLLFSRSEIVCL